MMVMVDAVASMAETLYESIKEFRRSRMNCDVTLVAFDKNGNERHFEAHRLVLTATVPFFHKMFSSGMQEAHSKVVYVNEVDAETLEEILAFIYNGRIALNANNVKELLAAADFMEIQQLVPHCAAFLKDLQITPVVALEIRSLYEMLRHITELEPAVANADIYIKKNFVAMTKTKEFLELNVDVLVSILSLDELNVSSESDVFNAAIQWLDSAPSDELKKKKHALASKVLSAVRLPLFDPEYLLDVIARNPIVQANAGCKDLINEALARHRIFLSIPRPQARYVYPRVLKKRSYHYQTIYTFDCRSNAGVRYDCLDHTCTKIENKGPIDSRLNFALVTLGGKIYLIGGQITEKKSPHFKATNSCIIYDPRNNAWEKSTITNMETARSDSCAESLDNIIYVCGGKSDRDEALDVVECYELCDKRWYKRSRMNQKRHSAVAVSLKGFLYVIGGSDGDNPLTSVERFNSLLGSWENVADMNVPRDNLTAVAFDGKIYVSGSYTKGTEIYDPTTDEWSMGPSLNSARFNHALVSDNKHIYAIGGEVSGSVEVFDPTEQLWKNLGPTKGDAKITGVVRAAYI